MPHEQHKAHHAHSEAHVESALDAPEVSASSSTKFAHHGALPPVVGGNGQAQLSASELAFGEADGETATASKPHHSAEAQMARLLAMAANSHHPRGHCYHAVKNYIRRAGGYGKIRNVDAALGGTQDEARDFATAVNRDPARFGLERLSMSSPFGAPAGAIVVVSAGSPGTHHPTAGDISVARGDGHTFYNDGVMHYGGPDAWEGNHRGHVLGVYRPK